MVWVKRNEIYSIVFIATSKTDYAFQNARCHSGISTRMSY